MGKTMDQTKHMLNYFYPILGKTRPELREHMEK